MHESALVESLPRSTPELRALRVLRELVVRYLEAPVLPGVLLLFRRAFVLKLFLWRATELGSGMFVVGGLKQLIGEGTILTLATWNAMSTRRSWPGTLVWLAWVSARNLIIFPRTFNLNYLDWIILLVLTVYPHAEPEHGGAAERRWFDWSTPLPEGPLRGGAEALAYRTLQVLMPIAFVQSVLAKLFHGYWASGDYLAYATFYGPDASGLAVSLRAAFGAFDRVFGGLGALPWPRELVFGAHAVALPLWARTSFILMSWVVLLVELAAPLLLIFKRTRALGVIGMMVTQATVAGVAGLYTWVFAGMIGETLWVGRRAVKVYRVIVYGMVAFSVASLLDRRGIADIFPFWFF